MRYRDALRDAQESLGFERELLSTWRHLHARLSLGFSHARIGKGEQGINQVWVFVVCYRAC